MVDKQMSKQTDNKNDNFKKYVSLSIDGIDIELNAFSDEFIKETIVGMLKAIKTSKYGVKDFKNIKITIDND